MAAEGTATLEFPAGFKWGSATAAYQIEGAAAEGGRSPSIWDVFCEVPGNIKNGDSGMKACDHYHRFREDIKIMKDLGLQNYRLSISWSRLLPSGRGEPNPEGLEFYNDLINELLANNIQPFVTLYHWDLPQCLQEEYGGWLSRKSIADFEQYAATCFRCFGDRVKSWITFNEPWCSTVLGFCAGVMAPGNKENPHTEPYLAAHHFILAHAHAVRRYRAEFKEQQKGVIGITLNQDWRAPLTDKVEDVEAAQRALDFMMGWYADPIWLGDYPASMREICGDRLPTFTDEEKALVKGSSEFFGLNHYSSGYVAAPPGKAKTISMWGDVQEGGYFDDQQLDMTDDSRWLRTDMDWAVVPWGIGSLCEYIQKRYNPEGGIEITECGCAVKEDTKEEAENDTFRVEFFQGYIAQVHEAIKNGADVRSFFAWSLLDNFEWALGYSKRFGIVRVDYTTQERTVKASGKMFSEIAKSNKLCLSSRVFEGSKAYPIEIGFYMKGSKDAPPEDEADTLRKMGSSSGPPSRHGSRAGTPTLLSRAGTPTLLSPREEGKEA